MSDEDTPQGKGDGGCGSGVGVWWVADEKDRLRAHIADRESEAAELTEDAAQVIQRLETTLAEALAKGPAISFDEMRRTAPPAPFDAGPLSIPAPPVDAAAFVVPPLEGMKRLRPGAKERHAADVAEVREKYAAALAHRDALEHARLDRRRADEDAHRAYLIQHADHSVKVAAEVDHFQSSVLGGDPQAVAAYFGLVFQASDYPDGFPDQIRLAYVPESKQLVVERELPPLAIVPAVRQYKHVKSTDSINESARPAAQVKALYTSLVAQLTLRTVHEAFSSDPGGLVETVAFNGMLSTVEPATGKPIRPCLVTVRATSDVFAEIDLGRADPAACLKHLNASVSKSPSELIPVRPVLEFDMIDTRFVEESDVLGTLDQRPNLMALTPNEFEHPITNLFTKMGLEARQTQASRDGGVDCVAYDPRP